MKLILSTVLFVATCLFLQTGLKGQDAFGVPFVGGVELDLLVIQVPESGAVPLVAQLRDRKQSEKATNSLLSMVADKKAKLVAWPVILARSGQRSVAEQVEEFRYATEYKQGERNRMVQTTPLEGSSESKSLPPNQKGKVTTVERELDAIPTGFETRNLGVTFEVEPVVSPDGVMIDLSFVAQHNWLYEMRRVEVEDKTSGRKIVVDQPQILTNKVTTSISVKDGDYTLLGTFKTKKPEGFIELFILHTQLKKVN